MVVINIQQKTYASKLTCRSGTLSNVVVRTHQDACLKCCKVLPDAELPVSNNFILFKTLIFSLKMSLLWNDCHSILFLLRIAIIQKLKGNADILLMCSK